MQIEVTFTSNPPPLQVLVPLQPDRSLSSTGQGSTFGPVRAWHAFRKPGSLTVPGPVLNVVSGAHGPARLLSTEDPFLAADWRNFTPRRRRKRTTPPHHHHATVCCLSSCLLLFSRSSDPQCSEAHFNQPVGSVGGTESKCYLVWEPCFVSTGGGGYWIADIAQAGWTVTSSHFFSSLFSLQFALTVWEGSSGNASPCSLCYRGSFVFCYASERRALFLCSCGFSGQCCSRFLLIPGFI